MSDFFLHAVQSANVVDHWLSGKRIFKNPCPKDSAMPYRADSGNLFTGINCLNLLAIATANGYESNGWISKSKLFDLGGRPIANETQSAHILMYVDITKGRSSKPFLMPRYYKVFNLDQTEHLPAEFYDYKNHSGQMFYIPAAYEVAEAIGLLVNEGDEFSYNQELDTLTITDSNSTIEKDAQIYRGIALSTIHRHRLDRELPSDLYHEALIHEITAYHLMAFYSGYASLNTDPNLISHWTDVASRDNQYIREACRVAVQIMRWVNNAYAVMEKAEDVGFKVA